MVKVNGIDPLNQALGFSKIVDLALAEEIILQEIGLDSKKTLFYYIEKENEIIGYFDEDKKTLIYY